MFDGLLCCGGNRQDGDDLLGQKERLAGSFRAELKRPWGGVEAIDASTMVWRVEGCRRPQLDPEAAKGVFNRADAYIILDTRRKGDDEWLFYSFHWVGPDASPRPPGLGVASS